MLRSQFLTGLGATPVALTLPGITSSIEIAVVGPLSGPARQIGLQLQAGAQGAIDEVNNYSIAVAGSTQAYTLRTYDDQNTAADAVLQAQFATGDGNVIAAIGHVNADATLQAIPTYGNASMPLIIPLSTDDRLTGTTYRNVFRLTTKDSTEGAIFARTVVKQYAPKVPYLFVQDADYGADVANGFIDAMSAAKIATPYQQFSYSKPDFGAVVDKALTSTPDYVFLAGAVADMGPIVPMLRSKGYTGPIGASQGFFDAKTGTLGAAANDLLVSTSVPYLALAPTALRWRTDYQAHGAVLSPVAMFGYAAAQIIISAISRSSATARNTLLNALQTGSNLPVSTIAGNFTFLPTGDQLDPELYFYTVRDGKFTYAHQAHPSTFMMK